MPVAHIPPPAIVTPAVTASDAPGHKVIGQASMQPDGTIVMDLRMEDAATGSVGDSHLTYAPGSTHYQAVLDHLGGLAPNQVKPVMDDWN